jgi:heme-degrading monooxygenase HmoA
MIARFLTVNLGPGKRDVAEGMADKSYAMAKTLPGFVTATYLVFDEAVGDYASMTVWKTAADATAAGATLGAWLQQEYAGALKAPPTIRIGEVYEPR